MPFCLELFSFGNRVHTNGSHEVLTFKSDLEEIAKYVLTILSGNVSRMLDFVYFLLMYRYAVRFESDLFHILL